MILRLLLFGTKICTPGKTNLQQKYTEESYCLHDNECHCWLQSGVVFILVIYILSEVSLAGTSSLYIHSSFLLLYCYLCHIIFLTPPLSSSSSWPSLSFPSPHSSSVCVCVGLIVPQVTYSVHISVLCRSPLLHIRLWSAGRPWAITVSLKGGWGDAGLINQSNFLSLCQRGDGSRWILSQRENIPGCTSSKWCQRVYMLRQHAASNNSWATIFIHLVGLHWQRRDSLLFSYVVTHTLNMHYGQRSPIIRQKSLLSSNRRCLWCLSRLLNFFWFSAATPLHVTDQISKQEIQGFDQIIM